MESIIDILSQGRDREAQASKVHGFVIGIVTSNQDPENLGRVKVKFPWLSDTVESWWARLCHPMAGPERGFWFIPEVDDEVLVGFEHGDVRFPYVIGALYNGQDRPDPVGKSHVTGKVAGKDGGNDIRSIVSRSGHTIALDDKDGEEMIAIADKTGSNWIELHTSKNLIFINSAKDIHIKAKETITIEAGKDLITKSGKNTDMKADGAFTAHAAKDMTLQTDAAMLVKAAMNMDLKAGQNLAMKATANVTIDGVQVTAKGSAKFSASAPTSEVKGDGMLTLKGGTVMIN